MNVAYIPLRGGSKSIPRKNIKPIAGKPLAYWVIKAACECACIDLVFVCTDCDNIREVVSGFGFDKLRVIRRSAESASDTATTEYGMMEFARARSFSNIALIQATSPLLDGKDIEEGFALLQQEGVDSVLSTVRQKRFIWKKADNDLVVPLNYDYAMRPRRQDFGGFLVENGAFYLTGRESLLQSGNRISGNIKTVEMPEWTYIELDEPDDWAIMESLLINKHKTSELPDKIPEIKMFLTDCDGTLTDGGMYYSVRGEEMKKFNTRDGAGLRMLKDSGIITGIITGEASKIVRRRAEKLGIDEVHLGISDKLAVIKSLCVKFGIDMRHVAYIGDDLNDYEAICNVGMGMCVADSMQEIKNAAAMITSAKGGKGAVREAAEFCISLMRQT